MLNAPGLYSVSSTPSCTITGADFICPGQTTPLCVPSGASSYLWSTGATTNCITAGAGTYTVTVTYAGGCTSTCSKTVGVSSTPTCTITGNDFICSAALSTQLCVPAGASSYLWSTGATTNCITVGAGTYTVTITYAGGCISICSKTVAVSPAPVCTITGSDFLCPGQSTQLCVPAGASFYLWSTGATTNCITVSAAGTYAVTITYPGGCQGVCSKTIISVSNCNIIPTLSQWGIFLFALSMLLMGLVVVFNVQTQRKLAFAPSFEVSGLGFQMGSFRLPFEKGTYATMLLWSMALAVAGFIAIYFIWGQITSDDIIGMTVAMPLIAYLLYMFKKI